jgi:hypothetical protein
MGGINYLPCGGAIEVYIISTISGISIFGKVLEGRRVEARKATGLAWIGALEGYGFGCVNSTPSLSPSSYTSYFHLDLPALNSGRLDLFM